MQILLVRVHQILRLIRWRFSEAILQRLLWLIGKKPSKNMEFDDSFNDKIIGSRRYWLALSHTWRKKIVVAKIQIIHRKTIKVAKFPRRKAKFSRKSEQLCTTSIRLWGYISEEINIALKNPSNYKCRINHKSKT